MDSRDCHPFHWHWLITLSWLIMSLLVTGCSSSDDNETASDDTSRSSMNTSEPPKSGVSESRNAFTLAVLPDTQKYAENSPERYMAQTRWIADHYAEEKIAFTVHLGDVVENTRFNCDDPAAWTQEWERAREAMALLEANPATPYSILAGNHDVCDPRQWESDRDFSREPFLQNFSPQRQAANFATYQGQAQLDNGTPAPWGGFDSYHIFTVNDFWEDGSPQSFIVLALDWRPSETTLRWASRVLKEHPDLPAILTTHQLMNIGEDGESAIFSEVGPYFWDNLVRDNDQIFLTINGHHHGEATLEARNAYGRKVVMEVVDYQSGYWGGNGMLQLITFDPEGQALHFRSFSPWVAQIPEAERSSVDELERWKYSIDMDFRERFANFNQNSLVENAPGNVEGTLAHWIFDDRYRITSPGSGAGFIDVSGNGNSLSTATLGDPEASLFEVRDIDPPYGYAKGTATFRGDNSKGGFYLETTAPGLAFEKSAAGKQGYLPQYTIEAVLRLPADWTPGENAWSGVLTHQPSATQVCQLHQLSCASGDPSLGLAISSLRELQWLSVPQNGNTRSNWSWEIDRDRWYHVAVVNDGKRTQMYVNGALVMRTGYEQSGLLVQPGSEWLVGASSWEGKPDTPFAGDIAEIRINNRPLDSSEWLYRPQGL